MGTTADDYWMSGVVSWNGTDDVWPIISDERCRYIDFQQWLVLCHLDFKHAKAELKKHNGCTAKVVTAADEAWALFCHVNNKEKWKTIAENWDNKSHPCHFSKKGGVYAKTKERGRYKTGFTDEGMDLYRKFLVFFRKVRGLGPEKWGKICQDSEEDYKNSSFMASYRQHGGSPGKKSLPHYLSRVGEGAGELDEDIFKEVLGGGGVGIGDDEEENSTMGEYDEEEGGEEEEAMNQEQV